MQEGEENQGVPLSLSILVREAAVLSLPRLQVLSPTLGIVHRVDCISARDKTHTLIRLQGERGSHGEVAAQQQQRELSGRRGSPGPTLRLVTRQEETHEQ